MRPEPALPTPGAPLPSTHRVLGETGLHAPSIIRRYSRFVGLMKLILPLIALLLVGLVIIWPQITPLKTGIRLGTADLAPEDVGAGRMLNPRFTGVDSKNQFYTVTAREAHQPAGDKDTVLLEEPQADILTQNSAWLAVTALSGTFRQTLSTLELAGNVTIFHDQGYEVRTEQAFVDLKAGIAHGTVAVRGHGPFGILNAQGFRIDRNKGTVLFTGKAKLTLRPGFQDTVKATGVTR